MKLSFLLSNLVVCLALVLQNQAFANFSINTINSPTSINFDGFDGSGFSPTPGAGQLDSDFWAVDGLSEGSLTFGGTQTSGDFALGLDSDAVGTGGIYAFDTGGGNIALGVQPTGADWNPGSFTLRLQNNTGSILTSLNISYSIFVYNDSDRSNSFNFSHSADNSNYTAVNALNFLSDGAADVSVSWSETSLSTTIAGLSLADGDNYYLRWTGNDFSGSGDRDQFGLDTINITAVPEYSHYALVFGLMSLVVIGKRRICNPANKC